jgi:hypothetical protein
MKQSIILIFLLLQCLSVVAQEEDEIMPGVDSLYREDQFYLGLTFHLLNDLPENISQSGFSGGLHAGFIRDIPLNKQRNIAIGTGIGWSVNTYSQELFIGQDDAGNSVFRNLDEENIRYDTNRFSTQLVELPLEFRWRTSTPVTYKFWRVYGGLKFGYIYRFRSTFRGENQEVRLKELPELQRYRVGGTLSFGYNTFNFHVYYSLNSYFENAQLESGAPVDMTTFKLGLMFYIL